MAERTAKQKAATRRMIAANRRGKSGGARRGSGGRNIRDSRRAATRTEHVGETASTVGAIGGVLAPALKERGNYGSSPLVNLAKGDIDDAVYNVKQNLPLVGKDPGHAANRALVGASLVVKALPTVRKVPIVGPFVRRLTSIKVSKRKRVVLG